VLEICKRIENNFEYFTSFALDFFENLPMLQPLRIPIAQNLSMYVFFHFPFLFGIVTMFVLL